jgi:hypothetical protein
VCVQFVILVCLDSGIFEEQYVCTRFCCKLGKNATETLEVLKVVYEVQTVQEYKFLCGFPRSKVVCDFC